MKIIITITSGENSSGPFDFYQNSDDFTVAFATAITYAQLALGYEAIINDVTTQIKCIPQGLCTNELIIDLELDPCFKITPTDYFYIMDSITRDDHVYLYGDFRGYNYGNLTWTRNRLMKLNADLTLDQTYDVGLGPSQVYYVEASAVQQWWDDKLIITSTSASYDGNPSRGIARVNTDGSYDSTYNVGTGLTGTGGYGSELTIDSQGRAIVSGLYSHYNGNYTNRIVRINQDGSYDSSLIVGNGFNNTTQSILMDSSGDDSFFVTGYFTQYNGVGTPYMITKLLENGSTDPRFDGGVGFTRIIAPSPIYMARIPGETSFYLCGMFVSYKGTPTAQPGAYGSVIKITEAGDIDPSFVFGTGLQNLSGLTHYYGFPDKIDIIWGDKLLIHSDEFDTWNGTTTFYDVVLNSDGTVFLAFLEEDHGNKFVIGNKLYTSGWPGECVRLVYTYTPTTTVPTTTVPPTPTTTTTTAVPTTTTTTAVPTTTTTTTTCLPFPSGEYTEFLSAGAITTTGGTAELNLDGDDEYYDFSIPFTFNYYGNPFTTIWATTNGVLSFDAITGAEYSNDTLPWTDTYTPYTIKNMLFPYWFDGSMENSNGYYLYTLTEGVTPNRVFVLRYEFLNIDNSGDIYPTNVIKFEVRLYETSNVIEYRYGIGTGVDAGLMTIGLQESGGAHYTEYDSNNVEPGVSIVYSPTSCPPPPPPTTTTTTTNPLEPLMIVKTIGGSAEGLLNYSLTDNYDSFPEFGGGIVNAGPTIDWAIDDTITVAHVYGNEPNNPVNVMDFSNNPDIITITMSNVIDMSSVSFRYYADIISVELRNLPNLLEIDLSEGSQVGEFLFSGIQGLEVLKVGHENAGRPELTTIDLSLLTALTTLFLDNHNLTTIDLSNNTALTSLTIKRMLLTSWNLTGLTSLVTMDCSSNKFTTGMVFPSLPALQILYNNDNQLMTSVDISLLTGLLEYRGGNNYALTSIDFTNNTLLTYIYCRTNQVLTGTINLINNTALEIVDFGLCNITGITNLSSTVTYIAVYSNTSLSAVDVSTLVNLTEFIGWDTNIGTLDFTNCIDLITCYVSAAVLTSLNLASCPDLVKLECQGNSLGSGGLTALSNNPLLDRVYVYDNGFTPAETDQFLIDVAAGSVNGGIIRTGNNRTSASDAAVATLQGIPRGPWTVQTSYTP